MASSPSWTSCSGIGHCAFLKPMRMRSRSFSLSSTSRMVWRLLILLVQFGFFLGFLQLHPKATSLPASGLQPHLPAKAFDPVFHNCQADACAPVSRAVQSREETEDLLLVFRGDPDAVVLHPETDELASFFGPQPDQRRLPRGYKFQRITHEIDHHLPQSRRVGQYCG